MTGPVNGFVATRTATATKTSTPIVEVPQSINVVPRDQITAQGAQTIGEALRYTPGVVSQPNGAADFSNTFMKSRGFNADLYLDGLRLPQSPALAGYADVEPYNVERIEVLKGPSSGLYGSSGPGGLVNMTSKRPLDQPFHEVAVQTGSYNRKQIQFDFSDRFVGSGDNALFRVVGLFRDADHQFRYMQDKREFIAPSLTLKNEDTKLTLLGSYFHSNQRQNFYNLFPASGTIFPNPNGRISRHLNTGEPAFDRLKREQYTAGYAFEHTFNEAVQFRQNLRYASTATDLQAVAMSRLGAADPRTGLLVGDVTQRNISRGALGIYSTNGAFSVDNQLEMKFATGPVTHDLVVGYDYRSLDATYKFDLLAGATPLDVFNPSYGAVITPGFTAEDTAYKVKQQGIYLQDQIKLGGWILTVGGRHDRAESLSANQLGGTPFTGETDQASTGRVGLGYKFDNGVVPYVSYGTSFDPVVGTTFAGTPFRPTTGVQYEGGVKYQPAGTKTLITAAGYEITQQNVLTSDPVNPFSSVQTGEVRSRGFEFEARTEIAPKLNLIAAYSYTDAVVTRSNIEGEVGNRPLFAPVNQASLWAQYGFSGGHLEGLTIGGGLRYVGETSNFQAGGVYAPPLGAVPPFIVTSPAYTLVDLMASYDFRYLSPSLAGTNLRINATNLFDEYYVTGCTTVAQCYLGFGRQVLATLTYRW